MKNKLLKAFAILILISLPASGQEKFMVCKNIDNVFTDAESERSGAQIRRMQGPPGKKGVSGSPGPPGLPGIQGLPGAPATVDYDRISELIENKIRRGLEEVESRVEMMKSNITELKNALPSVHRCEGGNGLLYNGKCYFTPSFSYSSSLNYDDAVQKCNSAIALTAEIHSRHHQEALENFFRLQIPSSRVYIQFWTGMLYQSSARSIRFRSGKEAAIDQFKWCRGYPSGSSENIMINIKKDTQSEYNGFFNYRASDTTIMVLCEI